MSYGRIIIGGSAEMKIRAGIDAIKKKIRANLSPVIVTLLILLFVLLLLWQRIFITIRAGEGGVLFLRFYGGTVVDKVYHEGFHVILPWDAMTKYNVRYQVIHHEMSALSRKGMKINFSLTIRYKPEYRLMGVLHQRIGPDYPDKIVIPVAEAVIRKIIGKFEAAEIYSTKRALIQKIVNEAIAIMSQRYVRIDDILITRVELPHTIREAIEAKLEERERAAAYEFKLKKEKKEAERKKIEAGGYYDYNRIIDTSLSDKLLTWRGIQATLELAGSNNAKIVVIGSGSDGLPIILDAKDWGVSMERPDPASSDKPDVENALQPPAATDVADTANPEKGSQDEH